MSVNKVVLLVGFSSHPYLFGMMRALSGAFLQEGVETQLVNADDEDQVVRKRLEALKPDFVFETNRTRNQNRNAIPDGVMHIAWIQDGWRERKPFERKQLHYTDPAFGGSDLIYTLIDPLYFGFSYHLQQGNWGRLHTGIDPNIHRPVDGEQAVPDSAAICGYIPLPPHTLSPQLFKHVLAWNDNRRLYFDYMNDFLLNKARISVGQYGYREIHQVIADEMSRYLDISVSAEDVATSLDQTGILQHLDTEVPRINDRLTLGEAALAAGLDLSVYGSDQWLYWPRFAPYYRGNLRWAQDLAAAYRATRFNLHNGCFGMHSRVIEAMGCGASVFVSTGKFDDVEYDIKRHFVPGEHYIPFDMESAADTFASWRGRERELDEIGRNAAEQTLQHHTWQHRAREILADVSSLHLS